MANRINFQIGYSVDKTGLQEMQSLFQQIANKAKEPGVQLTSELQKAASTANTLDNILEKTFNTNLGTLNVTKFNQELSKSGLTLKDVQSNLSSMGNQGATAYNRLAQAVLGTNLQLKESNKLLDSMATTMANTVKWGITSSIFNTITQSIQKAYSYSKQLNTSLNDIRIVTDKSADSMERFAEQANAAAKGMGASTLDYTNAALIYYQQGLTDAEVSARAETTIKAANVTGQTGEAVSEQLTAVWNGYKVTAEETELYVDKLAAVAATTAADLEELSVGMSKVAAAANSMGVDFDDLNAQIATIVSVTRQAPESVGTALKTIYARLGDLKVDGVDEFGVSLGEVSAQMEQMGIQILDQNGDMRDMTSVIAEVAEKWQSWTRAQQQAAAVAMAGKRQYNNLIALFENWDMYTDALNTSVDALGTLQHQQDIYMESTAAKLKTLKATWQDLYDGIIDQDELNAGIGALTNLVQVFDNFIDSFGGGIKSIGAFGAIVANIFNKQITDAINASIQRQEVFKQNLALAEMNAQVRAQGVAEAGSNATPQDLAIEANSKIQLEYAQKIYEARVGLNQEQYNTLIGYQKEIGQLEEEIVLIKETVENTELKNLTDIEISDILKGDVNTLDKINAEYGEIENKAQEQLSITKLTKEAIEQQFKSNEEISIIKNKILSEAKDLTNEEYNQIDILLKEVNNSSDLENVRKKILILLEKSIKTAQKNVQSIKEEEQAANRVVQAREKINQKTEQKNNLEQEAEAMLKLGNNAAIVAQKVTTITSSLGTMAMAWSSVNSLLQTWNDESASFEDKITQILITVGMTLPMIISSFSKLNEVFGYTTGILETFQVKSLRNSSIATLNAAGYEIESKALKGKTKAEIEDYLISQYLLKHQFELNGVRITNIALLDKEQKAIILKSIAEETDDKIVKKLIASQLSLNSSMLAFPGTWIIVILAALAGAVAFATKQYEKYIQAQIDSNNATIEKANKVQEEVNTNKELYDSYEKLYSQYKNNEIEKKDLYDITDQLAEKYEIEGSYLAKLTGNYDKFTEAIRKARAAELEAGIEASKEEVDAAGRNLLPVGQQTEQGTRLGNTYQVAFDYGLVRQNIDKQAENILKEYVKGAYSSRQGNLVSEIDANDKEAIIQQYEQISQAVEEMNKTMSDTERAGSEVYQNAKSYIDSMTESIEEYKTALEELKQYNILQIAENIGIGQADSLNEFAEKIEKLKEALSKEDLGDSSVDKVIKQYLSLLDNDYKDLYLGIEEFKATLDESGKQYIDSLSDEDKQILLSGKIEIDGYKTAQELQKALELAKNSLSEEDLTIAVSLREKVSSDKKLTKTQIKEAAGEESTLEKDYEVELSDFDDQSQLKQLDTLNKVVNDKIALNKKYIENAAETAKLEQDNLKIRQENWKKEKEILEEKKRLPYITLTDEEEARLKELQEDLIQIGDEIKNLQDIINNGGLNFDELNELNYDNLISGIDGIITEAEVLRNLTDDIGESWTIAADKIENFGKNFPEILKSAENYIFLQDGSLQLTEAGRKALEEVLNVRGKNLDAINKEYQLELQKQIDIQQATADYYNQQADLLQSYLNGEASAKDTEAQMEKGLNNYKAELSKITGENDEKLNKTIQTNLGYTVNIAKLNTKQIFDYWCEVGKAAEAASLAYENKVFNPPVGNFGGGGAKVKTTSYSGSDRDVDSGKYLKDFSDEQIETMIDQYRKLADDAANKAADYISKKVGAGAAVKAFENSSKNAISGEGNGKSKTEKELKEKELKQLDEEFDRYWKIKKAIDATDLAIKRLDKDQKNLYGYQLINSLKQENQLLEQQKKNYDALLKAQQQEAKELRSQLSTMGVMFDASGAIQNYAAATEKALVEYNNAVKQYNTGLIDETVFGVYEKSFENFKKLLERYDQLYYTEIEDTKDKLDDIVREQLANNLKGWEVEIELKLNLKELEREWNDFLNEINDDFKQVYKNLRVEVGRLQGDARTYIGSDGSIGTIINAINDVTAEIDKMRAGGFSNMFESISQAQEKLKELNSQLQSEASSLRNAWKEAWQSYLDGIDQVSDKFNDLMEQFERMNDELTFQGQIIELLYGEKAYDLMNTLYKGQEKSLFNQIKSVKDQLDMWKELWERSGATMENQSDWTQDQKKYYDQWTKAQGNLNDLVIDYIKLLKEDYLNTIDKVLNDLEKSLTGSSLKDMKTEWERISAYSDKYLDDVEQAYEAQKLANKIDQSIASASSLKNQQKLQALRDKEIKYLREKENLTQYDLDAAEARYQIALKEMALEDARNNKTSMKLVRNDQGNWSYQYLADEQEVINKQQDLLEAYSNLYQLASDAYEANLEALQDLQEKYLEAAKEIYLDETLSEEEKQQKLYELREWYFEQYGLLTEENTLYRNDLATSSAALLLEIYKEDKEAYKSMTDEERALVDALIDANIEDYADLEEKVKSNYKDIGTFSDALMDNTRKDWSSTAQKLADKWNADDGRSVKDNVLKAHEKIEDATDDYLAKVDECADEVEEDFGPDGITGAIEKASDATDDLRDRTEDLVYDSTSYLEDLRRAIEDIENAWNSVKDAIEDAIYTLQEYIRMMNQIPDSQPAVTPVSLPEYTPEPESVQETSEEAPKETPHRTAPLVLPSVIGVNPAPTPSQEKKNYYVTYVRQGRTLSENDKTLSEAQELMQKLQNAARAGENISNIVLHHYDTGGYTGSWNDLSEGRLAVLHQKELVLNKDDTSNFLSGISMLRDMTSTNGSISNAIMRAIGNMVSALSDTKINGINGTTINETKQTEGNTFNIYADFPNANDVNDIKEAILSLPNLASQWIAKNQK